jgi:hypothetical protein
MKKISILFASLIAVAALGACQKKEAPKPAEQAAPAAAPAEAGKPAEQPAAPAPEKK